jgi:glycosyltransferase involved in cell wall biosynthesis
VVTTAFPRWPGDAQAVFVWEAVRAIAGQGVDVRVVAMHSPGSATHERMDGIPIFRPRYAWPESLEQLRRGGAGGLPVTWEKYPLTRLLLPPFMAAHAAAVARHAAGCDLVHAHWTLSAAAAIAGRARHKAPVLLTSQGSDLFRAPKGRIGATVTRTILSRCDHVTVLSQALREQALSLGLAADRLTIIPNGVDTTAFRPVPVEREPIILYVGSLIERKGLDSLLPAFAAVHGRVPTARLLIIGEGPEADALGAMAEDLGIADQVTWLPFLRQADVRAWMQRARVLVLPSTEEGQGVVLLEAMACGTPVVGSRVGGIQDVITSDVGALVAPASAVELAEALVDLLDDAERWGSASQAARQRAVTSYDWDGLAKQFVALYQKIVARGNVLAKSD